MTNNKEALEAFDAAMAGFATLEDWKTIRTALNAMQDAPEEITEKEYMETMITGYQDARWFREKYPRGIKIAGGEK